MFSCEICEAFKNTFLYRTSPVVASGHERKLYINLNVFLNLLSKNIDNFWKVKLYPSRRWQFKKSMFFFFKKHQHLALAFAQARLEENCQQMEWLCCTIIRSIKRSWLPRLWIFNCENSNSWFHSAAIIWLMIFTTGNWKQK